MFKLLIIDDSRDILEAMELILNQKGYEVKTRCTAVNILEEVANYQPDLVIIDIFIGVIDGREICKELKTKMHEKRYVL